MANGLRRPDAGLIAHSDRGSQYTSLGYIDRLDELGAARRSASSRVLTRELLYTAVTRARHLCGTKESIVTRSNGRSHTRPASPPASGDALRQTKAASLDRSHGSAVVDQVSDLVQVRGHEASVLVTRKADQPEQHHDKADKANLPEKARTSP